MTPDVTIFADASHDPRTHAAGWAAWMKGNGKPAVTVGGRLAGKVERSYDAETFAVVNALYAARARGYFVAGQTVMLQSDCLHALNVIKGYVPGAVESKHPDGLALTSIREKRLKGADRLALRAIADLIAETPINIVVRHARGARVIHCDKVAKAHMREARREARRGAAA